MNKYIDFYTEYLDESNQWQILGSLIKDIPPSGLSYYSYIPPEVPLLEEKDEDPLLYYMFNGYDEDYKHLPTLKNLYQERLFTYPLQMSANLQSYFLEYIYVLCPISWFSLDEIEEFFNKVKGTELENLMFWKKTYRRLKDLNDNASKIHLYIEID